MKVFAEAESYRGKFAAVFRPMVFYPILEVRFNFPQYFSFLFLFPFRNIPSYRSHTNVFETSLMAQKFIHGS